MVTHFSAGVQGKICITESCFGRILILILILMLLYKRKMKEMVICAYVWPLHSCCSIIVIVLVAVELVKETKSRVRILSLRVIIRRGRGLGHALHARLLGGSGSLLRRGHSVSRRDHSVPLRGHSLPGGGRSFLGRGFSNVGRKLSSIKCQHEFLGDKAANLPPFLHESSEQADPERQRYSMDC
jgi:hypothetical protein